MAVANAFERHSLVSSAGRGVVARALDRGRDGEHAADDRDQRARVAPAPRPRPGRCRARRRRCPRRAAASRARPGSPPSPPPVGDLAGAVEDRHADRDVDDEQRAPADLVDEHAAERRARPRRPGRRRRSRRRSPAARRSGGVSARTTASEAGIIAAAAAPCSARAISSIGRLGASAHSRLKSVKPPTPAISSARRPTTSATRPAGASSAANDDGVDRDDPGRAVDRRAGEVGLHVGHGEVRDGRVQQRQEGRAGGDRQHVLGAFAVPRSRSSLTSCHCRKSTIGRALYHRSNGRATFSRRWTPPNRSRSLARAEPDRRRRGRRPPAPRQRDARVDPPGGRRPRLRRGPRRA